MYIAKQRFALPYHMQSCCNLTNRDKITAKWAYSPKHRIGICKWSIGHSVIGVVDHINILCLSHGVLDRPVASPVLGSADTWVTVSISVLPVDEILACRDGIGNKTNISSYAYVVAPQFRTLLYICLFVGTLEPCWICYDCKKLLNVLLIMADGSKKFNDFWMSFYKSKQLY